jgi:hypothetical protein
MSIFFIFIFFKKKNKIYKVQRYLLISSKIRSAKSLKITKKNKISATNLSSNLITYSVSVTLLVKSHLPLIFFLPVETFSSVSFVL